jgi:hypothetical protein
MPHKLAGRSIVCIEIFVTQPDTQERTLHADFAVERSVLDALSALFVQNKTNVLVGDSQSVTDSERGGHVARVRDSDAEIVHT